MRDRPGDRALSEHLLEVASSTALAVGDYLVEQAGGRYTPLHPSDQAAQAPWSCPRFLAACPELDLETSSLGAVLARITDSEGMYHLSS